MENALLMDIFVKSVMTGITLRKCCRSNRQRNYVHKNAHEVSENNTNDSKEEKFNNFDSLYLGSVTVDSVSSENSDWIAPLVIKQ